MLIGLRIQADSLRGKEQPFPTFAAGSDVQLALRVQASLANENCGENNPGLPCPDPDTTVVALRVSALADLTSEVDASEVVAVTAQGPVDHIVPLPLGPLAPGRHCVTVLVSERVEPVVRQQLPYHSSSVTRFFQVGTATTDHCTARTPSRYLSGGRADDRKDCGLPMPVLTEDKAGRVSRRLRHGKSLYANILMCRTEAATAVFARNGELVGRGSSLAPVTVSGEASSGVQAHYPGLERGDYLLLAIPSRGLGGPHVSALIGGPVLVT